MSLRVCAVHHSSAWIEIQFNNFENYLNKIVCLQSQPVYSTIDNEVNSHEYTFTLCFFQIVKEQNCIGYQPNDKSSSIAG